MKKVFILSVMTFIISCTFFNQMVLAQHVNPQKPISGRSGLDPSSRSKVAVVQSQAKVTGDMDNANSTTIQRNTTSGPLGKNCTTNVANNNPNAQTGAGNKYGSGNNNNQVVVVNGSVINICK